MCIRDSCNFEKEMNKLTDSHSPMIGGKLARLA
jgi:hypothetical protein